MLLLGNSQTLDEIGLSWRVTPSSSIHSGQDPRTLERASVQPNSLLKAGQVGQFVGASTISLYTLPTVMCFDALVWPDHAHRGPKFVVAFSCEFICRRTVSGRPVHTYAAGKSHHHISEADGSKAAFLKLAKETEHPHTPLFGGLREVPNGPVPTCCRPDGVVNHVESDGCRVRPSTFKSQDGFIADLSSLTILEHDVLAGSAAASIAAPLPRRYAKHRVARLGP